jgi:transcriptional regulator with XRE-family HTH domain
MTPEEYRAALEALDLTQAQAAKLMEVDERTSRRWALGERAIPGSVSLALELMQSQQPKAERLDAVATERWHELKAAEKLIRQLEKALRGVLFVAKSEPGPVHSRLRRDIREAEKVLEIVASRKRARRA